MFYKVSFFAPIIESSLVIAYENKDLAVSQADNLISKGYDNVKIQCEEQIPGCETLLVTDFQRVEKKVSSWEPKDIEYKNPF